MLLHLHMHRHVLSGLSGFNIYYIHIKILYVNITYIYIYHMKLGGNRSRQIGDKLEEQKFDPNAL